MSEKRVKFEYKDGRVLDHKESIAEIYQKRGLGKILKGKAISTGNKSNDEVRVKEKLDKE